MPMGNLVIENAEHAVPGILTVTPILMALEMAKWVYNEQFRGQ